VRLGAGKSCAFGGAGRVPYVGTKGWSDFFFFSERVCLHLYFSSPCGNKWVTYEDRHLDTSAFFFSMQGQVGSRTKTRRPDTNVQIGRPGASSTGNLSPVQKNLYAIYQDHLRAASSAPHKELECQPRGSK